MKTKNSGKAGQFSPTQIEANKLKQLQIACEKMAGKGSFNMFTALCKARMAGNRLSALKLKLSSDSNISPTDFKLYNDIFVTQLNTLTVDTLSGESMTLGQYLREGMTLVCYSEIVHELGSPNATKVRAAFQGYQRRTFTKPILHLLELMYRLSTLLSDLSASVFEYDINSIFAFSGDSENNHVSIRLIKSKASSIKLDGTKREIIPLQWPNYQGKVTTIRINPASLGLPQAKEPLPVYIQRHGLRRLSERIGIVSGLLHQALTDCFKKAEQIKFLPQGNTSLVEFSIYDQKLGYLVCMIHEEMVVIRTFLFITNDGTPEGKKLSELTRVQLLDKQYLGIDTLTGFIKFKVADDPILKALFKDADCESLLDLTTLEKFLVSDVTVKDPSILLNYLAGIADIGSSENNLAEMLQESKNHI